MQPNARPRDDLGGARRGGDSATHVVDQGNERARIGRGFGGQRRQENSKLNDDVANTVTGGVWFLSLSKFDVGRPTAAINVDVSLVQSTKLTLSSY